MASAIHNMSSVALSDIVGALSGAASGCARAFDDSRYASTLLTSLRFADRVGEVATRHTSVRLACSSPPSISAARRMPTLESIGPPTSAP